MNLRKSKLFHREKMQPIKPRDYPKVAAICGIIVIPPYSLILIMKVSKISIAKLIMAAVGLSLVAMWLFSDYIF